MRSCIIGFQAADMSAHVHSKGFTLIELLLAAGIFIVVMTIILGIFSQFMTTQRRNVAENRMLEEVRFGMEVFSREVRTAFGETYVPTTSGDGVMFRNQNGACVVYRVEEGVFQRAEHDTGTSECSESNFVGASFANLTGTDVEITDVLFDVTPSTVEEDRLSRQGFIATTITADSPSYALPDMVIQSSITSRQLTPYAI